MAVLGRQSAARSGEAACRGDRRAAGEISTTACPIAGLTAAASSLAGASSIGQPPHCQHMPSCKACCTPRHIGAAAIDRAT